MITESAASKNVEVEDPLVEAIEKFKMSSISMIASHLETEEEDVLNRIKEFVAEGILNGKI